MKTKNFVVKCIKSNNNLFLFGYEHKKGQFVTSKGSCSENINDAHIYSENNPCPLDERSDNWEDYYQYVPITIEELKIKK